MMADEKKRRVLEAANELFLRYGFRRTTMGDIAKSAGMSRPALYLVYSCKEEIFNAGVGLFIDEALAEIEAGLTQYDGLTEKLEFALNVWVVRPFEVINQMPDAKEVFGDSHCSANDILADGYTRFVKLLEGVLEPQAAQLPSRGMTTKQLAHLVTTSARGIKENATDLDELRSLIAGLITMTMATLGMPSNLPADRAVNA